MTDKCLNCPLEDEGLKLFFEALTLVKTIKHQGDILVKIQDDEIIYCEPKFKMRREIIRAKVKKEARS